MKFWQMLVWSETDQYSEIAKAAEDNNFYGVSSTIISPGPRVFLESFI